MSIVRRGRILSGIEKDYSISIDDDSEGETGGYYLYLQKADEGYDEWYENEAQLTIRLYDLDIEWSQ